MSTHTERGRRMGYGAGPETPKAAAAGASLTREVASKKFYGTPRRDGTNLTLAIDGTFDILETRLREKNDQEGVMQLRADKLAVQRALEERGVTHDDALAMMGAVLDHATRKHSPEALALRWSNEWERIRLAAGGTEAGEEVLKNANEFYKAIATAAPRFAEAVKTSGAAESAKMIEAAAKYPALPTPPPEAE